MTILYDEMLDQLADLKQIRFKEEIVNGESYTIVSYMIADPKMWSQYPLSLEARGITFHTESKEVVCRPFEKFFNLNENELTQESALDLSKGFYVYDKLDGSMITPVLLSDETIRLKTKKSFYSDVAKLATAEADNKFLDFCKHIITRYNATPIFEFISPKNRIVIKYPEDQYPFVLLAIRDMESGQYMHISDVVRIAAEWDMWTTNHSVQFSLSNLDTIKEELSDIQDFEGYVIELESTGQRVKMKSDWYMRNHRVTEITERGLAEMVCDETLDDILPMIKELQLDDKKLNDIIDRVINDFNQINQTIDLFDYTIDDRKAFAIQYKDHHYFPLAIQKYTGHDPDVKRFWKKHFLKTFYSTEPVYSFGE